MKTPSPLSAKEIVDEYFIENRTRLLEIAAFLDRLDRAGATEAARDFRVQVFREALHTLSGLSPDRVSAIQMLMSDPTAEPLPALDRKGAMGAFNPGARKAEP